MLFNFNKSKSYISLGKGGELTCNEEIVSVRPKLKSLNDEANRKELRFGGGRFNLLTYSKSLKYLS
jgi:hypothetical protein